MLKRLLNYLKINLGGWARNEYYSLDLGRTDQQDVCGQDRRRAIAPIFVNLFVLKKICKALGQ